MKIFRTVLIALVGLNACAFKKGAEPEGGPTERRLNLQSTSDGIATELQSEPIPNLYRVKLSWNADFGQSAVLELKRQDARGEISDLGLIPTGQASFVDAHVEAGFTYVYQLNAISGAGLAQIRSGEVVVAKDLEIHGVQHLPKIEADYNRLFLYPDSHLVTDGSDFRLTVNEIISDHGTIESFEEGQTAVAEHDGRSGGRILIKTRRGQGQLKIFGRGENGGRGKAGIQGAKGGDGLDGDAERGMVINSQPPRFNCGRSARNGQVGEMGAVGEVGHRGNRGGNAALVELQMAEASNLEVTPRVIPGSGGAGGDGGHGGPGGMGGKPGQRLVHDGMPVFPVESVDERCGVPAAGLTGSPGPSASPGPAGDPGDIEPFCLRLGNTVIGQCS